GGREEGEPAGEELPLTLQSGEQGGVARHPFSRSGGSSRFGGRLRVGLGWYGGRGAVGQTDYPRRRADRPRTVGHHLGDPRLAAIRNVDVVSRTDGATLPGRGQPAGVVGRVLLVEHDDRGGG